MLLSQITDLVSGQIRYADVLPMHTLQVEIQGDPFEYTIPKAKAHIGPENELDVWVLITFHRKPLMHPQRLQKEFSMDGSTSSSKYAIAYMTRFSWTIFA